MRLSYGDTVFCVRIHKGLVKLCRFMYNRKIRPENEIEETVQIINGGNPMTRALEMTPQKLKIGDFKYKTKESRLWAGRLRKGQPEMACVRNGEIQMQSITKELLNELPV